MCTTACTRGQVLHSRAQGPKTVVFFPGDLSQPRLEDLGGSTRCKTYLLYSSTCYTTRAGMTVCGINHLIVVCWVVCVTLFVFGVSHGIDVRRHGIAGGSWAADAHPRSGQGPCAGAAGVAPRAVPLAYNKYYPQHVHIVLAKQLPQFTHDIFRF